jgi:hypothetical protein
MKKLRDNEAVWLGLERTALKYRADPIKGYAVEASTRRGTTALVY